MRKKYLSALLFGALLFASAGTFTSCKDYDDDINNLQSQVDKLATKEEMEAKLSQMQTAIDEAKKTAEEALKKAEEAAGSEGSNEEIEKLTERVAALEEAMKEVEALKEEIKGLVNEELDGFREEMKEFMKKVEELTGYSLDMVTGISFVYNYNESAANAEKELDTHLNVNYARISDVTYNGEAQNLPYTFGKDMAGSFAVNKGDVNTVPAYMAVKLDPVNAVITSDMLTLVNGTGKNVNDYVDMTAEAWAKNLTTGSRAASATGLYKVGVQLKNNVDFEAFDKLVLPTAGSHDPSNCDVQNHGYNLFALGVSDSEKSRTVTSEYDVTMHVQVEKAANDIDEKSYLSSSANIGSVTLNKFSVSVPNDDKCFPVVDGEAFSLTVKSDLTDGGHVMASYVVVDLEDDTLGLSDTDIAAIKTLTITGTNSVIKTDTHKLTVSGTAGIAVPMKLVTIDYTGVVSEHIFWVKVSAPALATAEYVMTPTEYVADATKYRIYPDRTKIAAQSYDDFVIPAGADSYALTMRIGEGSNAVYYNELKGTVSNETLSAKNGVSNYNIVMVLSKDKNGTKPSKLEEVKYAAFTAKMNLQAMREDVTYSGVVKFYKGDKYLGSSTIKVTKTLPTVVPANFSAKTNGIVDGVMTVYPTEASGAGEYLLRKAFNNWAPNFSLAVEGVTDKDLAEYVADNKNSGDASEAKLSGIDVDIINNGEAYKSVVEYNYGNILFVPEGHGTVNPNPYKVTWSTAYSTKFGCWPVDCKYNWTETPVVYYRQKNVIKGKITKDAEGKITAFENVINAVSPYNNTVDPFDAADKDWTTWVASTLNQNATITLITENNGQEVKNEYFTAKFDVVEEGGIKKNAMVLTPTGAEVKVGNDVETKVILTVTDRFGHKHDIPALTFTMKINHE